MNQSNRPVKALADVAVGQTVVVAWNREPVRLVSKSESRTVIKPLSGPEREISPGVEVLPYDPAELAESETKPAHTGTITIDGQTHSIQTLHDLALLVCRLRHQKDFRDSPDARIVVRAGQKYGFLDADGLATSKYFALLDDEIAQLARELTGETQAATTEITYQDFSNLAKRRGHTVETLARLFRGKLDVSGNPLIGANDTPKGFFERVMRCRYKSEDRSDVVIPCRSVIDFYKRETQALTASRPGQRSCACGCRLPVFDRKKWASPGCRSRAARARRAA